MSAHMGLVEVKISQNCIQEAKLCVWQKVGHAFSASVKGKIWIRVLRNKDMLNLDIILHNEQVIVAKCTNKISGAEWYCATVYASNC